MEDKIPVVCSWYGKVIRETDYNGDKFPTEICDECKYKLLKEVQEGEHETN